jgi:ribosomal protein L40E
MARQISKTTTDGAIEIADERSSSEVYKVCRRCGANLPIGRYKRYSTGTFYLDCRSCTTKYLRPLTRAWRARNKEREKATLKKYRNSHPEVAKKIRQKWAEKNPDKALAKKRRNRLAKYKISLAEYEAMATTQGGKCLICSCIPDSRLCVDHCHTHGHVRGLLCRSCNILLGSARDSVDVLMSAIDYLKRTSVTEPEPPHG